MKIIIHSIWHYEFSTGIPKMEKIEEYGSTCGHWKSQLRVGEHFSTWLTFFSVHCLHLAVQRKKSFENSVFLCLFVSSLPCEWGMAGECVSRWNPFFIHPFSKGDFHYHPNIFSPQAKGNITEFFSSTSPSPYSDTLSLQRFPDIFISIETTASA